MPRPRKPDTEQLTKQVNFRISAADYERLRATAERAGMPVSDFLRHVALTGRVIELPSIINRDAFVELVRIGTNVNQIARRLNAGGEVPQPVVDAAHRQLAEILERLLKEQLH